MAAGMWRRGLALTCGLLETVVFSGTILGWASLNYMLKHQGVYSDLCEGPANLSTPAPILSCTEQDKMLNLAYTIGSFCMGSTACLWGFLLDKWGLRNVRLVINILLTGGCVLLTTTTKDTSYLVFPALILLSLGSVPLRIANMQIANYFPAQRSTIIALYSGGFSASASIFVFLKYGFDAGLTWEWLCAIMTILSLCILPVTLFLLPRWEISDLPVEPPASLSFRDGSSSEIAVISPSVFGSFTFLFDSPYKFPIIPNPKGEKSPMKEIPWKPTEEKKVETKKPKEAWMQKIKPVADEKGEVLNSKGDPWKAQLVGDTKKVPLMKTLLSPSFLLHQYWFGWMLVFTVIYAGTLNLWVARFTTDFTRGVWYTQLYGALQILCLAISPLAGYVMDRSLAEAAKEKDPLQRTLRSLRCGFGPMMATTLTEAGVQIAHFFNSESAVYVSIGFITVLRSLWVAVGTAYLRVRFPKEHFNRLLGVVSTVGAIMVLIQFPLFVWEARSPEDAFNVNIFETVLLGVSFLHPLLLLATPVQRYFLRLEGRNDI